MNNKNINKKKMLSKTLHLFKIIILPILLSEEQAMNGLYGMPETDIEDADHAASDDLTSKINYIEKSQGKYPWLFNYTHPLFVSLHSSLKVFLAKKQSGLKRL